MDISGVRYELSNYAPPSWSPNGDRLAIEFRKKGLGSGNSSASAIGILDPEKKLVLKLADGVDPSWFPSGDEVAYFNPKRNQCLASRLNGEPRVLFKVGKRGAGAGRGPLMFPVVWSPDGKALLFHQWVDPDLITNVYKLDLTSGKSKKVAHSEVHAVSWRSSHPSF
jgi:Tol biopolymer transport system component